MSVLFPRISPASSAVSGQQPPDSTFGAFLIGNFVGLFLYGITLHQTHRYACTSWRDPLWLKCVVAVAVLLETCSSILGIHSCYFYLVINHSLPLRDAFTVGLWSLNLYPLVLGLVIVTSQSFFIRRLWLLGTRPYKAFIIISSSCSLAVLALCTAATAKTFIVDDGAKTRPALAQLISRAFLLALVADCLLTVMLVHVLHNSRTGIKSTNSMIDIMIIYSVRTGLLTGVFDLLTTIFAFVRPTDNAYIAIGLPGARILNSRQSIAARASSIDEDATAFGTAVLSPIAFSGTRNSHLHTRSAGLGVVTTHDSGTIELDIMPQRHASSSSESTTKYPLQRVSVGGSF